MWGPFAGWQIHTELALRLPGRRLDLFPAGALAEGLCVCVLHDETTRTPLRAEIVAGWRRKGDGRASPVPRSQELPNLWEQKEMETLLKGWRGAGGKDYEQLWVLHSEIIAVW